MTLAIFDLDNTLIAGDSDHAWGEFLVERGLVDGDEHRRRNDEFYQQYQQGGLDIETYLRFALAPIAGKSPAELSALHQDFMASYIVPMRLPQAQALIDKHRQQGHRLMIITATNRFVTEPIARAMGIKVMLASEPELRDGRYTGDSTDIPCFQAGKVVRLQRWLRENGETLTGSYFYSDSHNDLPLLKHVDNPVAVDPDDTLRAAAEEAGWPIVSLR